MTELIWEYDPDDGFRADPMIETMAPVVEEYAVLPEAMPDEADDELAYAYIEDRADYEFESAEMLEGMGIRELETMTGLFVWRRHAGSIDVTVSYTDRYGDTVYGRCGMPVDAEIIVAPVGWREGRYPQIPII